MDRVSRQDLIARKPVFVQEHDGSAASREERGQRCTGAPGANNDDVITGRDSVAMVTLLRLVWSVRATPARAGCPKMLRRVRAPRPPALGHGEQFAGCRP